MPGHLVQLSVPDYDNTSGGIGYGYRIGDNYVLTAGHVFFDWNRHTSGPTINDIVIASPNNFLDYRDYRGQYLIEVNEEIANPSSDPDNAIIEGQGGLPQRDTIVVSHAGSLGSNGDGMVVFLDRHDLENVVASVGAGTRIYREGHTTLLKSGTIVSTTPNGLLEFSLESSPGDSGGVYLLRTSDHYYIIGTHSGNLSNHHAQGTYFSYVEWQQINNLMETGHTGNISTAATSSINSEPTNLVVGSSDTDVVEGSFRPDIILGRGGDDSISDGDRAGDTVWANDTLIGGDGGDIFFAGRGNDIIWGGNENQEDDPGNGEDQISYEAFGPVTLTFNESGGTVSLTATGADIDTDTLHSIERVVLTDGDDYFNVSGSIPTDYRLTVDGRGGLDQVANAGGANSAIHINIPAGQDVSGTLTSDGGGTIYLLNFHTQIIGSSYNDEITDESDGRHTINAGTGDDTITVDGGDSLVRGGYGDDTINGGQGNDRLFGEDGTDIVNGGGGSDWLENQRYDVPPDTIFVDADELDGDEGADYLHATATSADAILSGGAGNDVIDARGSHGVTIRFGAGDGHSFFPSCCAGGRIRPMAGKARRCANARFPAGPRK